MENSNLLNVRRMILLMVSSFAFMFSQAVVADAKTVTLTQADAEILYQSLVSVTPAPGTLTKNAYITFIQQYDGPGPFTYLMVYSDQGDRSKTYKIEFPENMTSKLASLSEALYLDGKGLAVTGNPPHHTQTVTDAVVTCSISRNAEYKCVLTQ